VRSFGDLAAAQAPSRGLAIAAGVGWIVAALVVVLWPGITVRVLTLLVGIALIVSGVLKCVSGFRGTTDQRVTAIVAGSASIAFGVLALAWPDVTVFVIAVVFGARMVLFGLSQIWDAIRGRRTANAARAPSRHSVHRLCDRGDPYRRRCRLNTNATCAASAARPARRSDTSPSRHL
jgi:uncharacterized membrane protein HdeD (DUF308 family)